VSAVGSLVLALAAALPLQTAPQQAPQEPDCAELTQGFLESLAAWRSGDAERGESLRLLGDELCRRCERCDAAAVAGYYLALAPDALRAGLDAEQRFTALFEAVQEAGQEGVVGEAWRAERERLGAELRALYEDVRGAPDWVPAARALSLAARLEIEALELEPDLDPLAGAERLVQARADVGEALELFERAGFATPQLEPRWLAARIDLAERRFKEARRGFEELGALATKASNLDYREHALRGLARLARAAGDARSEDRLLVELAEISDPRTSWPLARDWAARLLAEDHAEEALDFLERCAPPAGAHRLDELEWHLSMGAALSRLGELEAAREHLERAATGAPSESAVLALAQLALEEGRGFEVRDLVSDPERRAGFSARGQAEALRLLGEEALEAGDAEGALRELDGALRAAESWREALAARLGGAQDALGPGGVESVFGEWAGLHTLALYADAARRCGRPLEGLRRIAEGHSRSLREARAGSRWLQALASGQDPAAVSPGDLEAWIRQAELGLVAWVVGADFGVVVHAWSEGGQIRSLAARLPRGRAAMADQARRLREAVVSGDAAWLASEALSARAAVLPDEIAAGLEERARAAGPDARLLLIAHGPLERIPFELLPLGAPGQVLDELCTVLALPGLPDALPQPPTARAGMAWSLCGPPPEVAGWPSLPAAEREIAELAELHPNAWRVSGESFTAAELAKGLASGRAMHLATHLTMDGDSGPALLLAGGERADAEFVREHAAQLPLVVLPACETGGGAFVDAQGLHGLARAFLEAGARELVVTLWPVQDDPARRFSIAFHRALLEGATPARAARAARAALRSEGLGAAEWAAFRVLGSE
jgi:tetratricopeptide (TPR) repeat protein